LICFFHFFNFSFLLGGQKSSSGDKSIQNEIKEIKNPKIFNMLTAYDKAQYPFILISDSGLMMHEDTLYDMAKCMDDNVGLVHQMPFTCDREGFAGSVEKVRTIELRHLLLSSIREIGVEKTYQADAFL
jgi:cellulose synthase/poly-beta-1,6-N-acetylglucosamine synthase-like glycosyltransferase